MPSLPGEGRQIVLIPEHPHEPIHGVALAPGSLGAAPRPRTGQALLGDAEPQGEQRGKKRMRKGKREDLCT